MVAPAVPYVMAAASVGSAILQGQAQDAQLSAQQAALKDEQKYLAQQREFLEESRQEELELFQEQTRELIGVQEVSFARAGIEMSGSALRVVRETAQDAFDEEQRINKQFDQYRTLSDMKSDSINRQISSISSQKGMIPLLTGVSALSGGLGSFYSGQKIISKNKVKLGGS